MMAPDLDELERLRDRVAAELRQRTDPPIAVEQWLKNGRRQPLAVACPACLGTDTAPAEGQGADAARCCCRCGLVFAAPERERLPASRPRFAVAAAALFGLL